jgi:RNA polymerase sigma-70 factor (ECF subfamily)
VLKAHQRAAFKAALQAALAGLGAKERNLLRMHLLHGLSIDEIGRAYQVHRATAARWLATTREALHRETRRLLRARLGLTDPEFDSVLRAVESQLDASFRRLLTSSAG